MTDLRTDQLDYDLPPGRIATRPTEPRDAARLLVCHRGDERVEHRRVRDLPEYLEAGDLLVRNTTAVVPARIAARRVDSGGRVEGLWLEPRGDDWLMMLRSNGRLAAGQRLVLLDAADVATEHELELLDRDGAEWVVRPPRTPGVLEEVGRTPLPPYIRKARGAAHEDDSRDPDWYQTIYADAAHRDSVAAPTAGLHFSPELMTTLAAGGVAWADIVLHVGPGTFRPVSTEHLAEHPMHAERYVVPPSTLATLRGRRERGGGETNGGAGRIIAVGTTTVRCLESLPASLPQADGPLAGSTRLLIAPPYDFRFTDALMTNFHLPRSTLLALVAALLGLERTMAVYGEAVARGYRFYSYGDAMLILP